MGNIKTCIDTSRSRSTADDKILEERFTLLDEAHKYLYDYVTGNFRTIDEAIKIVESKTKK